MQRIGFKYNDGGREAAGFKGDTGDCVTRAIAIATGEPYQKIYDDMNRIGKQERRSKNRSSKSTARGGVYKPTYHRYLLSLGWKWTPTMFIGQGCKVHLRKDELPKGTLIVSLSQHLATVVDGILQDTERCDRKGMRCVYGYYQQSEKTA